MNEEMLKTAIRSGFEKIEFVVNYKGEDVYEGVMNKPGGCFGFPFFMTMREGKVYRYERDEILDILGTLPDE